MSCDRQLYVSVRPCSASSCRRIAPTGIVEILQFLARHIGVDWGRCIGADFLNAKGLWVEYEPIHSAEKSVTLPVRMR